jgi:DNA-binding MarR family transcriptional regulator
MSDQLSAAPDELLDSVALAFLRLHRMWSKPQMRGVEMLGGLMTQREMTRGWILQVVDEGSSGSDREVTVGVLAERLDLDPSAASRLVSSAIKEGHLVRFTSEKDARRSVLSVTDAGLALLLHFRRQPRVVFETITKDWPTARRDEFARFFTLYVDEMARIRDDQRGSKPVSESAD